jgi:hypothetical protein
MLDGVELILTTAEILMLQQEVDTMVEWNPEAW